MDKEKRNQPEVPVEENEEISSVKRMSRGEVKTILLPVLAVGIAVFLWSSLFEQFGETISQKNNKTVEIIQPSTVESSGRVSVTEKGTEAATEVIILNTATEKETEEDWKQMIFGNSDTTVMTSQIQISGLSSNIRNVSGFKESDFVRSLSGFLSDYNIKTGKITLQENIACSSPGAVAYQSTLSGIDDKILSVLIYPDYPGYYVFSLVNVPIDNTPSSDAPQARQEAQETSQTHQTENVTQQVETAATEPIYDASRLTIADIPATLLNYIDNRYELQYSLYDYLYRNGYKEVTKVNIESYEIDPDARTATFYVALPSGERVVGIYDLKKKSYTYS